MQSRPPLFTSVLPQKYWTPVGHNAVRQWQRQFATPISNPTARARLTARPEAILPGHRARPSSWISQPRPRRGKVGRSTLRRRPRLPDREYRRRRRLLRRRRSCDFQLPQAIDLARARMVIRAHAAAGKTGPLPSGTPWRTISTISTQTEGRASTPGIGPRPSSIRRWAISRWSGSPTGKSATGSKADKDPSPHPHQGRRRTAPQAG